jgi:hypothetical protein
MQMLQSTKAVIAGVVGIGTLILLVQLNAMGSSKAHTPPTTVHFTADAEMEWQMERQRLQAELEKAEQRANLTAIIASLIAEREKEKATPITPIVPLSPTPPVAVVPSPVMTPSTAAPARSSTPSGPVVSANDTDPSSCSNYRDSDPFDMPLYCQPLHAIVSGYSRNVTHLFDRLKKDGRPYTYYTHGTQTNMS